MILDSDIGGDRQKWRPAGSASPLKALLLKALLLEGPPH